MGARRALGVPDELGTPKFISLPSGALLSSAWPPWPPSSRTPSLCLWPALNHLPKPASDLPRSWESSAFYIALAGCHYLSTVSWQQALDDHRSPTPTPPHVASDLPPKHNPDHVCSLFGDPPQTPRWTCRAGFLATPSLKTQSLGIQQGFNGSPLSDMSSEIRVWVLS